MHSEHDEPLDERGEAAQRNADAQVARLRQALAEATQEAEAAQRERRERTRSLRRGAP